MSRPSRRAAIAGALATAAAPRAAAFARPAETPPMGWNSWDCWGAAVREDTVRANAAYMAEHMRPFGWQYVVVDIQWYEPNARGMDYRAGARLTMDAHGRLLPAPNRFPSAAEGAGFGPLAAYCHGLGLKFGLHMMRGIPRQAVAARTPIEGSAHTAADAAATSDTCGWNTDMYGVDPAVPAAQDWYDSVFRLYRTWGVDFVKVDDLSQPFHGGEISLIRHAIDRFAPGIVFSTSPGETPLSEAATVSRLANMWRTSGDFWDDWQAVLHHFDLCARWAPSAGPGHWPDADMLPFGRLNIDAAQPAESGRHTKFTPDEMRTVMTLWCMARSPLMAGANLPDLDAWTLGLLTDPEVLAILRDSHQNRELLRGGDRIAWTADAPHGAKYAALFNTGDAPTDVGVTLAALGLPPYARVRNLWQRTDEGGVANSLVRRVPAHGAQLYRLTPARAPRVTGVRPPSGFGGDGRG